MARQLNMHQIEQKPLRTRRELVQPNGLYKARNRFTHAEMIHLGTFDRITPKIKGWATSWQLQAATQEQAISAAVLDQQLTTLPVWQPHAVTQQRAISRAGVAVH